MGLVTISRIEKKREQKNNVIIACDICGKPAEFAIKTESKGMDEKGKLVKKDINLCLKHLKELKKLLKYFK